MCSTLFRLQLLKIQKIVYIQIYDCSWNGCSLDDCSWDGCSLDGCFLDGCFLRWLFLNIFADFEQVKKLSSYFADFEQVKKPNSKTSLGETGCIGISFLRPLPCVTGTPPWLLRPMRVSTSSELYPDTWLFFCFLNA